MSPGKGTQVWKKGVIYEGDWKFGRRDGYGTLSYLDAETGKYRKVYSGWWKGDRKSVSAFACVGETGLGEGGLPPAQGLMCRWEKEGVGNPEGFSEQKPGNRKERERAHERPEA